MQKNTHWFSIVEILVWVMIFSLGLVSIYMLIASSMKMNEYSKNSIIASNLAREGIEIVRNVRDNNYATLHNWNKFPGNNVDVKFQTGIYYKVENDLDPANLLQVIDVFQEGREYLADEMKNYQLYLTPENYYTYDQAAPNTPTYFYRYLVFDDVKSNTGMVLQDALKLKSKVIWYKNWYHEIELDTILADFQRY